MYECMSEHVRVRTTLDELQRLRGVATLTHWPSGVAGIEPCESTLSDLLTRMEIPLTSSPASITTSRGIPSDPFLLTLLIVVVCS